MRILARRNTGSELPPVYLDSRRGFTENTEFPVTIGSEYAVYAVTTFLGGPWYYVLDDDRNPWPVWKPAPLFEIVDPHLPPHWTIGYHRSPDLDSLLISWPEWSGDDSFYEHLVDRRIAERELFQGWVRQLEPNKESYL